MEAEENREEIEVYNTISVPNELNDEEDNIDPNTSIKIDKDQYSIFELKRKYDKGKICMDPSFQRNFVWKSRQMSELIESVIMGIPLPLIYLAESENGDLIVVDGRQRLTTFFKFLNNEFHLNKLSILKEINGYNFKQLEEKYDKYASSVEDFQLVVQIIKYPTPDRIRFDIFDRVNRGGTPLNKQEMRNALYQGKATELLNRLSKNEAFRNAIGCGISDKHMKDKYIILRALAFYLYFHHILTDDKTQKFEYKSDMEDFLGTTMKYLNRCLDEEIQKVEELFVSTMNYISKFMDKDVFRLNTGSERKQPISMTLFETLFYLFSMIVNSERCISEEKIQQKVNALKMDEEFLRSLRHSVDSTHSVKARFRMIEGAYKELSNV